MQCRDYDQHQIRGKESNVGIMLEEKRKHLLPLPGYRFDPAKRIFCHYRAYPLLRTEEKYLLFGALLAILERKGRAIIFAKPVKDNVSDDFLVWFKKQNLEPKSLCRCRYQYLEYGPEAVITGHLTSQKAITVTDPVAVKEVDLTAYDQLKSASIQMSYGGQRPILASESCCWN